MRDNFDFIVDEKIHFIGIGGVSMSGIAKALLFCGKKVSGSDTAKSDAVEELISLGAEIQIGHFVKNVVGKDLVVVTSAISEDNPELVYAKNNGIPIVKRSEVLGKILQNYKYSVAVSGSHGKTTSTAMITRVLDEAGNDPTSFIGGNDVLYGNYRQGQSQYAVVEACEYRKNFLDIKPMIAVVLNIDNDHGESYLGMQDVVDCFRKFTNGRLTVINADDVYSQKLQNSTTVSFGIENLADYYAKNIKKDKKGYSFDAYSHGIKYGRINLSVLGKHNIYNALSAFAVGDILGVPFFKIKKAIENFSSVKRRNEYLGDILGISAYADYAHHPREIDAMLKTFSEEGNDYITVFQPHTYSRTRLLKSEFISSLKDCDKLIIYKTYPAREKFDEQGSAFSLCADIRSESKKDCFYAENEKQLLSLIKNFASDKKRILFLGAGDIYDIAKKLACKNV